ncbi:hypothetical protein GLYMA_05G019850v4 [Glycine max]|nr:hypothetical protein GLYMA_05G019850v4 [Glycine max]KAH1132382.1 hypothetical protein GYH30_011309 [Glycine max]
MGSIISILLICDASGWWSFCGLHKLEEFLLWLCGCLGR